MITISPDNGIIHQSKNLRGITAHSHRHGKPEVTLTDQRDGSAQCYLRWPNGDTSHFSFASARLADGYFSTRASNVTRHAYAYEDH